MDILEITDLRLSTIIGTYPWEQQIQQTLRFDIKIATDAARAASQDDLSLAIDYAAITEYLKTGLSQRKFKLLETVAEMTAQQLLANFPISWLQLAVTKFQPIKDLAAVTITIERQPNNS